MTADELKAIEALWARELALASEVRRLRKALHDIACDALELTGFHWHGTTLALRDRLRGINGRALSALEGGE